MQPSGARKNKLAQAMFSNDGPNLSSPAVTKRPRVTPKIYKLNKSKLHKKSSDNPYKFIVLNLRKKLKNKKYKKTEI